MSFILNYLLILIEFYFKFLIYIKKNFDNFNDLLRKYTYNDYCYYIAIQTDDNFNIIYDYDNIKSIIYFNIYPQYKDIFLVNTNDIKSNDEEVFIIKYVQNKILKKELLFNKSEKNDDDIAVHYVTLNEQYNITKYFKEFSILIKNKKLTVKQFVNLIIKYSNQDLDLKNCEINIMFDNFEEKVFKENEYIIL